MATISGNGTGRPLLTACLLIAGACIAPAARCDAGAPPSQRVIAPDGAAGDFFGETVRIRPGRAIIGSYGNDELGMNAGKAYIYRREGSVWTHSAILTASDGAAGDHFGRSVDIDGDYAAVGAYQDDDGGTNTGSVYIFRRDGAAWVEHQKLNAPALFADPFDRFGRALALRGSLLVAGAPFDNAVATDCGAAYVFRRVGSEWVYADRLLPSDGAGDDRFGKGFDLTAQRVLAGSSLHDTGGEPDAGAAYVYRDDGGAWTEEAKLTAPVPVAGARFGVAVSIEPVPGGDIAVVGSPNDAACGTGRGAAYLYRRADSGWVLEATLCASDGAAGDWFGWTVSVSNGQVLVGAVRASRPGMTRAGRAYLFRRVDGIWTETLIFDPDEAAARDELGCSLWLSGGWAIIGANGADDLGDQSGAAYFLRAATVPQCPGDADGDGAVTFADITAVLANFGADYGPGGAGPGDANGDGAVGFADISTVLANMGLTCE